MGDTGGGRAPSTSSMHGYDDDYNAVVAAAQCDNIDGGILSGLSIAECCNIGGVCLTADGLNEWMDNNVDCSFGLFVNDFLTCTEEHIESEETLVRFTVFAVNRLRCLLSLPFKAWRNREYDNSDGDCWSEMDRSAGDTLVREWCFLERPVIQETSCSAPAALDGSTQSHSDTDGDL